MSVIIVIKSTYNSVQSHTTFSDSIHPVAKLRLCSRIIIHINASWTEKERIILRLLSASGIVVAWKQLLYSPPSSNTHQFPPRSAAVGVDGMGRSIFWMSAGSEYLHLPLLAWTILLGQSMVNIHNHTLFFQSFHFRWFGALFKFDTSIYHEFSDIIMNPPICTI